MTTHITVGRFPPDYAIPDVSEPASSVPALCPECSGLGCDTCCFTGAQIPPRERRKYTPQQERESTPCVGRRDVAQGGAEMSHKDDTTPSNVADMALDAIRERHYECDRDADRLAEALRLAEAALGGYRWLWNNRANADTRMFRELFDAAHDDEERARAAAGEALRLHEEATR